MLKKMTAVLVLAGTALLPAHSYEVIEDGAQAIKTVPMRDVYKFVESMAKTVNDSAPMQIDSTITVTGATFLRSANTLMYSFKLNSDMPSDAFAVSQRAKICQGRTVVALMERTIMFAYKVSTPRQNYTVTYSYFDC